MTLPGSESPKVFISYAWSSQEHEEWILRLATRLVENGVDVVFDKWDLKIGDDKYAFMESMATSPEIDKILVICDREYQMKADDRRGGVGTETQILSPGVYEKVTQTRVVPIIAERNSDGSHCAPTFIKSRIFIDMSADEKYEEGYEQLLRLLFDRPLYRKPNKGAPPSFLFEDSPSNSRTKNIVTQIKDATQRNPNRVDSLSNEFTQVFIDSLKGDFEYSPKEGKELDDIIFDHIHNMLPFRDDYIKFVELQCERGENLKTEVLTKFFEKLYSLTQPNMMGPYDSRQFDQFKFLIYELYIFTIMILLDKEKFLIASELLNSVMFVKRNGEIRTIFYTSLSMACESLDTTRNQRLQLRRLFVTGDIITSRVTDKYTKDKLIEADMILFYHSVINGRSPWLPKTIYHSDFIKLPILQRLQSRKFVEKMAPIFGAKSLEEMKDVFRNFRHTTNIMEVEAMSLQNQIDHKKIGIYP